ncbi:MAG: hypothetical protein L6Q76_22135, partial [Polyangiaceae bacterium]|nr:hypothetical protein [Polyangiaceae bacterium]
MKRLNAGMLRDRSRRFSRLPARAAIGIALVMLSAPSFGEDLRERPMIALEEETSRARVVSSRWIELILPENEYDAVSAADPTQYLITSAQDPDF